MPRLYVTPLPDAETQSSDDAVRTAIQSSGLIQEGGVATEKIAAENIDVTVEGQFRKGKLFGDKLADELESLGESNYESVPLFGPASGSDLGRNRGYYEVERVDVEPDHPQTETVYQFTAGLSKAGTRETHWRAVATNNEPINTTLATASSGVMAISADADKTKWFDVASGTDTATATGTENAEFGDLSVFDPTNSTYDDPTLIYELPFDSESPTDVRVLDDRGKDKYYTRTINGDTVEANQWTHVYHTGFEFNGLPVVDNGLLRLKFDEANGTIPAEEWNDGTSSWDTITYDLGDYKLVDADFRRIGPARVDVYAEFEDTVDGSVEAAVLSIQRGIDRAVVRDPDNATLSSALQTELSDIASNQTTDAQPNQTVISRSETK